MAQQIKDAPNMKKLKSKILSALCLSLPLAAQVQATPRPPERVYNDIPITSEELVDKYIEVIASAKSNDIFEITPFKLKRIFHNTPNIESVKSKYIFDNSLAEYEAQGSTNNNINYLLRLIYSKTNSHFHLWFRESKVGFGPNIYCPIHISKLEDKLKNAGFFQLSKPEKLIENSRTDKADVYLYRWGKNINGNIIKVEFSDSNKCLEGISFDLALTSPTNK